MRYSVLLFLIVFVFGCETKHDLPTYITIDSNWQFKKTNDSIWYSATVPGNIFSDLLDNKLIEDPFIEDNEDNVQWVSETDWEYKTNFSVDNRTLKKKHIELNFEGLDTYASVYLNDSLILISNNAFRAFEVDVKKYLNLENELRIIFEQTSKHEKKEKTKLPYSLPEGNRIFTRKAQFQYGWDWGPKLNTSGIWRPIKLIANNDVKFKGGYIHQLELNDSIAKLNFQIDLAHHITDGYTFELLVNGSLTAVSKDGFQYSTHSIPFEIKNPKLWWPHNLGEPYLYDIKVLVKDEEKILDSISVKHGIRTIHLVTEKDSVGETFYFKVNDVPIYAKGANYIPQHSFQNKVTKEHYENLLNDVVDANMNMLRVWGGGIYENDIFYDLCDEKGILVWQDFMFACAMYPGDETFLRNVKQEAIDNVKRLRNHASIALWCGNNENSEGWHRWGWQEGRSDEEKEEIWSNYLKVFDSILPNTVKQYSDTDYWESSPKYGRGNPNYQFEGDAHDWWVWHDGYPFEHFENNIPRFMSEFGFQSFPSYQVIQYINQKDSIDIISDGFINHQKHHRGFELIEDYMQRDYPVPDNAEDYVYMSQLVQAYGITKGIKAHRRAKPYNMGTLYWQLNDCWPAVSWSSIDYFGNWKALHYYAKKAFENVLISSIVEGETLQTFVVNDNLKEQNLNLKFDLFDLEGRLIWSDEVTHVAEANASTLIFTMPLRNWDFDKRNAVLKISSKENNWLHYFSKPKDLKLQNSELQKKISKTENGYQIELSSSTFHKDVFLYCEENGHFSDNFFDLLPNETKTINFLTTSVSNLDIQIKTFNSFIR